MRKLLLTTAAVAAVIGLAGCGKKEPVPETPNTFTDTRDGQTYKTVKIGEQTWMAQNINYQTQTGQSWCYGNDNSKCNEYGRLYDWNTAKTVCMPGWHLPSRQEWSNLVNVAGGDKKAGKKLKAKNGWNNKGNGTDGFGFSALPGGYRYYSPGAFRYAGYGGDWWTATEIGADLAYTRAMYYGYDYVREDNYLKSCGFSVRCVQD